MTINKILDYIHLNKIVQNVIHILIYLNMQHISLLAKSGKQRFTHYDMVPARVSSAFRFSSASDFLIVLMRVVFFQHYDVKVQLML